MIIGSLGKVIFACSSFYIKTINNMSIDKSVNWIEHKMMNGKPKLQFDGENLDSIKFDIHLNSAFNVNPLLSAKELEEYMKKGNTLKFILGRKVIGSGWYVITSISETHKTFSSLGVVTKIELSIELKEYN